MVKGTYLLNSTILIYKKIYCFKTLKVLRIKQSFTEAKTLFVLTDTFFWEKNIKLHVCSIDWCQGGHQPKPGSADECEPCPLGKYKPSGQSGQCLECEKNFYQDETGAEGCKSCPKKRPHTMFKGSISVTLCSAGNIFKLIMLDINL
jgi:hypothetical protein